MENQFSLSSMFYTIEIEKIQESEQFESIIEGLFFLISQNIRITKNLPHTYNFSTSESVSYILEDIRELNDFLYNENNTDIIPFLETEFFKNPLETKPKIEYLIMKYDSLIDEIQNLTLRVINEEIKQELKNLIYVLILNTHNLYSFCPGFVYKNKWNPEGWDFDSFNFFRKDIEIVNLKKSKFIWSLPTRFKLFQELGYLKNIRQMNQRNDQNLILAQIMGINPDNAKKLINGTYNSAIIDTEELECEQLIQKINTNKNL
jgi:hypothetical protein